ncbi:hypothetical protein EBP34_25020 [Salmonella enterica subsp. enterica serovar Saintpaul]|nr:hypothetical protein [Salmonella enterica subsp. enterica serovar Saintpaul]EFR6822908.1 hypothetical protein [Salmonella enterica]EHJ0806919.1 hypothetical protein [Salmonella enterica]ELS1936350.1 hypothetical protein [Salmonella enterica]
MKKLIIAAGIAAATMASFGASARDYVSSASVNTVVTGDSGFSITTVDKELDATSFKAIGADLGRFAVTVPNGATTVSLSGIHAHDYPKGYEVKIAPNGGGTGQCVATVGEGGVTSLPENATSCEITEVGSSVNLDVSNNTTFAGDVIPGTKTLTVKFTSTVN